MKAFLECIPHWLADQIRFPGMQAQGRRWCEVDHMMKRRLDYGKMGFSDYRNIITWG